MTLTLSTKLEVQKMT